jgi:hypothetical protein
VLHFCTARDSRVGGATVHGAAGLSSVSLYVFIFILITVHIMAMKRQILRLCVHLFSSSFIHVSERHKPSCFLSVKTSDDRLAGFRTTLVSAAKIQLFATLVSDDCLHAAFTFFNFYLDRECSVVENFTCYCQFGGIPRMLCHVSVSRLVTGVYEWVHFYSQR